MRIALLVNGMTGYLDAEFAALHRRGVELFVATPGSPDLAVGAMRDTAFSGLACEQFAEVFAWSSQPDPATLLAKLADFRPDAVLMTAWNFSPAYRAVMRAAPPNVVRGLIMDNTWHATSRQWLGRLTHRWYIDPVADFAVVPSEATEFFARRLGFAAADIVRGSISADTDLFCSPPRKGTELRDRRSFLHVGRLVEHKGAAVLAKGYMRYRRLADTAGVEPWDLRVVGIGPLGELLDQVKGVRMEGFLQPPAVAELMREVSCYVLPSIVEPYGVVVHEAAASALPLICSDHTGALAGFVQDGHNGWVVPARDADALADAMLRMTLASPERLAEMSQVSQALSERLSPGRWAQHLIEELDRRIVAGGGRTNPHRAG